MNKAILISILLSSAAYASNYSTNDFPRIVAAIYKVEGGAGAKYKYGIVSVKVKDDNEAKRICLNTVKNNYWRWKKAGGKGNFIEFLGARYAPIGVGNDPRNLNKNWIKNMKRELKDN